MKRYVRGGAQEAAEILIELWKKPHISLHFEFDDNPECVPTVRYDVKLAVIREIEEGAENPRLGR